MIRSLPIPKNVPSVTINKIHIVELVAVKPKQISFQFISGTRLRRSKLSQLGEMWRAFARRARPLGNAVLFEAKRQSALAPASHLHQANFSRAAVGYVNRRLYSDTRDMARVAQQEAETSMGESGAGYMIETKAEEDGGILRLPLPPGVSGDKFGLYELKGTAKDWKPISGSNAVVAVHGPEELWAPAIPNEGAVGGQFAVVAAGGTQHKVMVGDVLYTNRIQGEVNEDVMLEDVLVVGAYDWTVFGRPLIGGASVVATVEEQTLSGKLLVAKFKKRKGYLRRRGHRQPITRMRIMEIRFEFPKEGDIVEYKVPFDPRKPPLPNHSRPW